MNALTIVPATDFPAPYLVGALEATTALSTLPMGIKGLRIDWETRSTVDLLKHGVYAYAMHPSTIAVLAAYRIDDGPIRRWWIGQPCPQDIRDYLEAGGFVVAHNAAFERLIWNLVMATRFGWPTVPHEKFICTATIAAALVLPRSLEKLGSALGLPVTKDKRGKQLIELLSKPKRIVETKKGNELVPWNGNMRELVWNEDPELLEEFMVYCERDLATQDYAYQRMVTLSDSEWRGYALNERINDRGIRIDVEAVQAAMKIIELSKAEIDQELSEVTGGAVTAVTQTAKLKTWCESQGVLIENTEKDTIEETLAEIEDLPTKVERALELRLDGAKSTLAKLPKMLDLVNPFTGRVHGVYVWHGAGQTGRLSARGLQVHNLSKYRKIFEEAKLRQDVLFRAIKFGDPRMLRWLYGPELGRPMHLVSDAIRGFIWAAPGHEFINVDYTSIEGVVGAWLAEEAWKLAAYWELLEGTGPGMYELFAAKIYQVLVEEVTKKMRATGKIGELSMGYQGGVSALARMARSNKVKLFTLFDGLWESLSDEQKDQQQKIYQKAVNRKDRTALRLGREGYIAGNAIKVGWRDAHPNVVKAWDDLDQAAKQAVMQPGTQVDCLFGRISYLVADNFLWCRLPSGRVLAYGDPQMRWVDAPWDLGMPKEEREKMFSVTVLGVGDGDILKRRALYGGAQFNNVTQGTARDILIHGMETAEEHGYRIVMDTHDEMQAEMPYGTGSVDELMELANRLPTWIQGAPLRSAGWNGKRYRKD